MADLNCRVLIPEVDGLEDNQMTVGRHQILNCEGNWDKSFDFTKAQVKLEENQKLTVKVFKAEARDIKSFDIDFTLYQAGQYQFPNFIITDGNVEIDLGPQKFSVASVIKPPEDGQPPKPFGPMLPITLSWPVIYFISVAAFIGLAIFYFIYRMRRRARYKRLVEVLRQHDSSIDPDLQFYRSMRGLEKIDFPMAEIEKTFKLYILRVFQVPFFELSNGSAIRFMKRRRPQFVKQRQQIQKFLDEIEELSKKEAAANGNLDKDDKNQFVKRLYRFVDTQKDLYAKKGTGT